ncbi:hypothetical protein [Hydrogenophaga electricum]|uniref:Ribbon-helix-helix protein CopG domain-containing protein n=1 Tax=Hydrogenophaga electricum TaxID=1230953 RepID=A0ABQ6C130_9BURK|nr:hypothetical protein [Hydrogenophaga electricum]GLS13595.1 hypothetical protein GCM10007935_10250 [Hydrogenophaga electricum]
MNDGLMAVDTIPLPTPYELGSMSTQTLRGELAKSLTMSARHLQHLALIWAELEKRGEDLSDLRTGLAVYLPMIAAGRLDAEAVIRFAGQPTVLRSLANLPVERQHALALGGTVPVLTVNAAGEYQSTELPAHTLTAAQARLVFSGDSIRSPAEQRAVLESARVSAQRRPRPGPDSRVRYDAKADVIRIGRSSATVGEVAAAIASGALSAEHDGPAPVLDAGMLIRLTESEHRMIKARAAEAGVSQQDLVRNMLKAALAV